MFKGFLVSVGIAVVLAVPPAAQGRAVTLDPGTRLKVVCEDSRPLHGKPFREAISSRRLRLFSTQNGTRLYGTHPNVETKAAVYVRPRRHRRFVIRVLPASEQALRWRGC